MSDIKLLRVGSRAVQELTGATDTIEKSVQILFEKNLDALLGVRFLTSESPLEWWTCRHAGLDENVVRDLRIQAGRERVRRSAD